MLDIKVTKTTAPKAKPDEKHLGFGTIYTDHMFIMDYTEDRGWHDPRIEPYAPSWSWTRPRWCFITRRSALRA